MECIHKNHKKFGELLTKFAMNDKISWRYLPTRWEHITLCSNSIEEDRSFLMVDGDEAVACCQLTIENDGESRNFSSRNKYNIGPMVLPQLPHKLRSRCLDQCFDLIDLMAKSDNISRCLLELDPTADNQPDLLQQQGYIISPAHTSIIDLSQNITDLKSNVRRRYKSFINSGIDTYEFEIFDVNNINRNVYDEYVEMHHVAAKRVTRPLKTFELQYDKFISDNAMLVGLKYNGAYKAFCYNLHNGGHAYYGSAADYKDPDLRVPFFHSTLWVAIEYYHKRGFHTFELGEQVYGPQLFSSPSQKDVSISFFKRGFGGSIVPVQRGVKYYDREAMRRDLDAARDGLLQAAFPAADAAPEAG